MAKFVESDEGGRVRAIAALTRKPPRAAMEQIGILMVAASQRAFREGGLQGGGKWPDTLSPNVPAIINRFNRGLRPQPRHLVGGGQPLVDEGRLRGSISHRVVGTHSVEVGSNLPYSGVHQDGGTSDITLSRAGADKLRDYYGGLSKGQRRTFGRSVGFLFNFTGQTLTINVRQRKFLGLTRDVEDEIPSILLQGG